MPGVRKQNRLSSGHPRLARSASGSGMHGPLGGRRPAADRMCSSSLLRTQDKPTRSRQEHLTATRVIPFSRGSMNADRRIEAMIVIPNPSQLLNLYDKPPMVKSLASYPILRYSADIIRDRRGRGTTHAGERFCSAPAAIRGPVVPNTENPWTIARADLADPSMPTGHAAVPTRSLDTGVEQSSVSNRLMGTLVPQTDRVEKRSVLTAVQKPSQR